jgi:hypothetical protein
LLHTITDCTCNLPANPPVPESRPDRPAPEAPPGTSPHP